MSVMTRSLGIPGLILTAIKTENDRKLKPNLTWYNQQDLQLSKGYACYTQVRTLCLSSVFHFTLSLSLAAFLQTFIKWAIN